MTKEEYRKHCEEQIERCIKLRDTKHLREHELSLALLNECEDRKQREDNLIKYLEDIIRELKYDIYKYDTWHELGDNKELMILKLGIYQDILERIKNNNYD